jgi:hypothetical protein
MPDWMNPPANDRRPREEPPPACPVIILIDDRPFCELAHNADPEGVFERTLKDLDEWREAALLVWQPETKNYVAVKRVTR